MKRAPRVPRRLRNYQRRLEIDAARTEATILHNVLVGRIHSEIGKAIGRRLGKSVSFTMDISGLEPRTVFESIEPLNPVNWELTVLALPAVNPGSTIHFDMETVSLKPRLHVNGESHEE